MGGEIPGVACREAGHPVPDENGFRAAGEALALVQGLSEQDAVVFLLGVVGIILTMILIRKFFKIDTNAEIAEIEHDEKSSMLAPHIVSLRVTNRMVDGLSMKKLHTLISCDYVISRIEKPDGTVIIPKSEDVINYDDVCLVVCSQKDEEMLSPICRRRLGPATRSTPARLTLVTLRL